MQTSTKLARTGKSSGYEGVKIRGGVGAVSIGQIGGDTLRAAVDVVTARGDAILFGRTSDGGALSVRVLSDGATSMWYPTDASELQELLDGLIALK